MRVRPDILVQAEQWHEKLPNIEAFVERVCTKIFLLLGVGYALTNEVEISIVLSDDAFIKTLNASYRGKNTPTNVLSFPALDLKPGKPFPVSDAPAEITLGDVIIALETVEREAKEQNKSFEAHTAHMLVHGVLHLLGYDHMTDVEAEEMEALEIAILRDLDINNPYEVKV